MVYVAISGLGFIGFIGFRVKGRYILWYILRTQRGSHIPTLMAKYIPYSHIATWILWVNKGPQYMSHGLKLGFRGTYRGGCIGGFRTGTFKECVLSLGSRGHMMMVFWW